MRYRIACVLGIAVLAAGCESKRTPAVPAAPVQALGQGHRWGEPFDWVNAPPPIQRIDFSALTFEPSAMRDALQRWEAATQGMYDNDWHY